MKKMSEGKWCYSFNEENFEGDFETKEQAIAEAIWYYKDDNLDQDFIYVGQTKEISLGVNVDRIIEDIGDNAYDQAGEYAEDYLTNVTVQHGRILEERLNDVLVAWMKEFKYEPNFWTVANVEKIEVGKYLQCAFRIKSNYYRHKLCIKYKEEKLND